MEDLQEEADRLFDSIRKGDPSVIEEYRGCDGAERERFLNLMDKRRDNGSNMLIFAITNRKYGCAKIILEILRVNVEENRSSNILLARDDHGNDCLRMLLLKSANLVKPAVLLGNKQLTSEDHEHEKEDIDELFHFLIQFTNAIKQLATEKETTGAERTTGDELKIGKDGIILWAIKNQLANFAMKILRSLPCYQQLPIIANKEQCTSKCHPNKHDEECRVGYNLLMMALVSPIHEPLVQAIVDIVCTYGNQAYVSEVVMGKNKPEVFSQSENCLRLAARNSNGSIVMDLVNRCVPADLQCDALLEVGPPDGSVMKHLLVQNELMNLKDFLQKTDRVKLLRKSLVESAERKRNFLQLEMRLSAVELFEEIKLFHRSFLIPRPGELSRPLSLNYWNRFSGDNELPRTREEVKKLTKALNSLGWSRDNLDWSKDLIKVNPVDWTTDQLLKNLEHELQEASASCSLLLLCVTSHGEAGRVLGKPKQGETEMTSEYLDKIVKVITVTLPKFIPKVLIFDMCRTEPEDESKRHASLRKNNILVLHGTTFGTDSEEMTYIPALAKQIGKADGVTSLQKMHNHAAQKVKNQPQGAAAERPENIVQISEGDENEDDGPQIAHKETTVSRDIILRRYDGDETNCNYCGRDVSTVADRLICIRCLKYYHLVCTTHDETQKSLKSFPEIAWLCSACHKNIMQQCV